MLLDGLNSRADYQMLNFRFSACFRNLHLLKCVVLRHYSTVTASTTNESYVNYLVHSLGLTPQRAVSISTKLTRWRKNNKVNVIDSKFVENANRVVTFFHHLGFHQAHIRNIVSREPRLLASSVDKTLKPKIRALQDEDFSRSDVIRVISTRPTILVYGLESTIIPVIQIQRQAMGSISDVIDAITRFSEKSFRNVIKYLLPNVALLSNYGVPIELIRKHLLHQPWYYVRHPVVFKDIVTRSQEKLGITHYSPINLYGINSVSERSEETFHSKCRVFKGFGLNQSFSNYLVYHLGFSHQQALSTCTKLSQRRKKKVIDFKFVDNANSVVTLFHQLGFDDTLLRHIVFKHPQLLASNIGKTLQPKITALKDEGFSRSDIIRVISSSPAILFLGMESTTLPAIQILRQVMGRNGNSNVIKTIERLGESYFHYIVKSLLPNVALLTSYGVPIKLTRKQILHHPVYYVQNPEVFKYVVMRVEKKLGIARDSPMFLSGINLISGMTEETFESKCRIFKSFGWTQSDVDRYVIKNASRFLFSDERIKKKLHFLMNKLQLKPAYLISHNCFMTCSLEKRIVPRHKILQILKTKGLLKRDYSLYYAILMSELCFLKKFVLPFKEVHEAYAKLIGCSLKALTDMSAAIIS